MSRIVGLKAFEPDAIQLVARKVQRTRRNIYWENKTAIETQRSFGRSLRRCEISVISFQAFAIRKGE